MKKILLMVIMFGFLIVVRHHGEWKAYEYASLTSLQWDLLYPYKHCSIFGIWDLSTRQEYGVRWEGEERIPHLYLVEELNRKGED